MGLRTAKNISLADICPNCERRIWFKKEPRSSSRRYHAPKWFRDMFIQQAGRYNLGTYYLDRCEVCGKTVAVFDDNAGRFYDEVLVFYACTLLSVPLEPVRDLTCKNYNSCYGCSLKEGQYYVKRQ